MVEIIMVLLQAVSYHKTNSQQTLLQAIQHPQYSSRFPYASEVYGFQEATKQDGLGGF